MSAAEFAPAKVNLALHVRQREADGYHALETLFVFADVGDRVAWEGEGDGLALAIDGPFAGGLSCDTENLVLRAARALAAASGIEPGARLRLTKSLPVASGLGGGSADAAATFRLLNRVWGLDWPLARLATLGAALGADVAACVHSTPLRGEGRGERLAPIAFAGAPALLVNPGVAVSTAAVFRAWDGVDQGPLAGGDALAAALGGRNDLQAPAIAHAPAIADTLALLGAQPGVTLARMSGSGATCFSLFADARAVGDAAAALASKHPDWWIATTRLLPS